MGLSNNDDINGPHLASAAYHVIQPWSCSKKSVQQDHSHFSARSVLARRELGKRVRTLLADFLNRPLIQQSRSQLLKRVPATQTGLH